MQNTTSMTQQIMAGAKVTGNIVTDPDKDLWTEHDAEKTKERLD